MEVSATLGRTMGNVCKTNRFLNVESGDFDVTNSIATKLLSKINSQMVGTTARGGSMVIYVYFAYTKVVVGEQPLFNG